MTENNENSLIPSLADKKNFLSKNRSEIRPLLDDQESLLLDRIEDLEPSMEGEADSMLEQQETKVMLWERHDAKPDAKRFMVVLRDPGPAVALEGLLSSLKEDPRVSSIGLVIDGVAQKKLGKILSDYQSLDNGPLVMSDILRLADKPFDVIINTMSAHNGPESVSLWNKDLLSQNNPQAKSYMIYEGYEGSTDETYQKQVEQLDGIFCNDELAKEIIKSNLPNFPETKIYATGTGQVDSIEAERSQEYWQTGREKLSLGLDDYAVIYLGTVSENYQEFGLDPEVNEKTWFKTVADMKALALSDPARNYALLYRPHPRDPKKDELLAAASENLPKNLTIKLASDQTGISLNEALYAADALASMTLTESIKSQHRNRPAIYLGYDEPGMAGSFLQQFYSPEIIRALEGKGGMKIIKNDNELLILLSQLKDQPIVHPGKESGVPSSVKILDKIFAGVQS